MGGTITVRRGNSGGDSVDIGGGTVYEGKVGDCNTVIILVPVNSGGDLTIGGGKGTGADGGYGSAGQGIRPASDGTYTVYGNLTLPCDVTIPDGATVTIPSGTSLTVPEGVTLTNCGTILVQGGEVEGAVSGNQPAYPSKVTVSFSQNGQTVTSVPYGSTVTVTVTIEKAETATNALSADAGKVDFYLGAVEDGTKLNQNDVPVSQGPDGTYTAALEVTLDGEGWKPNESPYTITADFGGHGPEGDESGDRLAPNTGSAELTVTKAEQSAPSAPVVSTAVPPTANSVTLDAITTTGYGDVQYGYITSGETSVPDDRWQAGTAFDELDPGTTYAFYTRYAGNECYEPSTASAGSKVTTLRADSTLKVEPDEDTLTYGETLTITVTPEQTAANGINTQTAQNAVELRKGDTVLTGTTTVNDDGSYTLIYDTQDKGLTIGSNTLTVSSLTQRARGLRPAAATALLARTRECGHRVRAVLAPRRAECAVLFGIWQEVRAPSARLPALDVPRREVRAGFRRLLRSARRPRLELAASVSLAGGPRFRASRVRMRYDPRTRRRRLRRRGPRAAQTPRRPARPRAPRSSQLCHRA